MRTVEVLFVIIITVGAFLAASQYAILPSPRQIFGTNLRELATSTLQVLDSEGVLTETSFKNPTDPAWRVLEGALTTSLPPNIVFNFSVFDLTTSSNGVVTYQLINSISDANGFGSDSEAASCFVTSPNVTYSVHSEKIGEKNGKNCTLYLLDCEDSNGWWITGYTAQTFASDLHDLLSPYFATTILVNSTDQLGLLLDGTPLNGEDVENAVIINTCGEAVPIPSGYADQYSAGDYAEYCYILGQRVNQYNWTFVSIVGYPLYYVSNTVRFADSDNTWGIYGMERVGPAGLNAFLQGIDEQAYNYDGDWITGSPGVVYFTPYAREDVNYYGLYPAPYHTATRALPTWITSAYNLNVRSDAYVFEPTDGWIAGATFTHQGGGAFTAIGLTRTPDVRVAGLALLMYYRPRLYRSEYGASGTSRLVTLQLSQQGGT